MIGLAFLLLAIPPQAPAIVRPPQAPPIPAGWPLPVTPAPVVAAPAPRYGYQRVQICRNGRCRIEWQLVELSQ